MEEEQDSPRHLQGCLPGRSPSFSICASRGTYFVFEDEVPFPFDSLGLQTTTTHQQQGNRERERMHPYSDDAAGVAAAAAAAAAAASGETRSEIARKRQSEKNKEDCVTSCLLLPLCLKHGHHAAIGTSGNANLDFWVRRFWDRVVARVVHLIILICHCHCRGRRGLIIQEIGCGKGQLWVARRGSGSDPLFASALG